MGNYMDQDQLTAMAAELVKGIKIEKDPSTFMQQLVKLTVDTALNRLIIEFGDRLDGHF